MTEPYEIVIGLEVHVQLLTESKMFCGCSTKFGEPPNTLTCPVCIGMPGSLPVMNRKAYALAVKAALALNCQIARFTKWDRKNYYYPDLPKGYQISQYDLPLSHDGFLQIADPKGRVEPRRIGIIRVHLEEDAGKSMHDEAAGKADSRIDLNRAGTPLLEIVSQPDLRSPAEAKAYLTELKLLLNYLGVSDCNMQEGSLRVDANINLHVATPEGTVATPIVEVKNMNSFRAVERALAFEAQRQYDEWLRTRKRLGEVPKSTRGWDETQGITWPQRSKEEEQEYRYFPDPDLVPLRIDPGWIARVRAETPELPAQVRARLMEEYGLGPNEADWLTQSPQYAEYFQRAVAAGAKPAEAAAWMMGDFARLLNATDTELEQSRVTPEALAELLKLVDEGRISGKMAKAFFERMFETGVSAAQLAAEEGGQIADAESIGRIIDRVIAEQPDVWAAFVAGDEKKLTYLMGQVMKASRGKANPQETRRLLMERMQKGE